MSKESKNVHPSQQQELFESFDIEAFKVEAVASVLPAHILYDDQKIVSIKIEKAGLSWEVSAGRWGMPGPLAYKIESLYINHQIDRNRPELPKVVKLGSMREILRELGMAENGTNISAVKRALRQNASAFIQAVIPYRDNGNVGSFEIEGTRYVIVFQNQVLPDGQKADAIYIVFHDVYLQLLRSAPVRPISSTYLKHLSDSPFSLRLYELLRFQFYSALQQRRPYAVLRYSEYCAQAPLPRKTDRKLIQPQMWRIHNPHLMSRYIKRIEYEPIEDSDLPDFNIKYYPGILARQEYELFCRESLPGPVPTSRRLSASIVMASNQQMSTALTPSQELVAEFQTLRYGESQKRSAKSSEESLASGIIKRWGVGDAKQIVRMAYEKAEADGSKPTYLTGLGRYIEEIESERTAQRPGGTQGKGARRS